MFQFLLIFLAPLLIWQGRRVHRRTLRLPEADGQRYGIVGQGSPINLLVLGDSAAAGVGCLNQQAAIAGQLVSLLSQHQSLQWQLVAKTSLTCAGVCQLLSTTKLQFSTVDAVVISVGVNDVTRRTTTQQWQRDLSALTDYLKKQLGAAQIVYTGLPPMHQFPALPQPLRWVLGKRARRLDELLRHHCQQQSGVDYLHLDMPFQPEFMARDGFHPSAKATPLWAAKAAALIRPGNV